MSTKFSDFKLSGYNTKTKILTQNILTKSFSDEDLKSLKSFSIKTVCVPNLVMLK